jgi:signal transduction histidine kinase
VLFQAQGNPVVALLATGLVALLVQPVRTRLQRGVNRLMYGERDDPVALLSHLGQRLEATMTTDAVIPTIVETVAEALRLPYAAITLKRDDVFVTAAAYGQAVNGVLTLPLVYQGETIGRLILAPRTPGEDFTPGDRRLLENIARQTGAVAHAVRLTDDLQRSRERLVTAREEERRRLRRDLHDGLGPALAAQSLKVGSARTLYARDPATADALLAELETDIAAALGNVRRLVYDLRPPTLDELGLIGAIRESAAQYGCLSEEGRNPANTHQLQVIVKVPERLPPLPAAVEVAAYRIVQEALTNVVRHARATTCIIDLSLWDGLHLEITDDGVGLPVKRSMGVGLASMRERAGELGGTCTIERRVDGGTCVWAHLPLAQGRLPVKSNECESSRN